MTTLNSRLQLAFLNRKKGRNLLEKGFTLVELMIVIVIVAVLSSVALPNFLRQSDKAKATEAKTGIAAILKQAQADFIESGNSPKTEAADLRTYYGAPPADTQKFNYTGAYNSTDKVYTVTATGLDASTVSTADQNLSKKVVLGCVSLETGVIQISQNLLAAGTTTDSNVTCK